MSENEVQERTTQHSEDFNVLTFILTAGVYVAIIGIVVWVAVSIPGLLPFVAQEMLNGVLNITLMQFGLGLAAVCLVLLAVLLAVIFWPKGKKP